MKKEKRKESPDVEIDLLINVAKLSRIPDIE